MTHGNAGHYAAKHPEEIKCNPQIAEALKQIISGEGLHVLLLIKLRAICTYRLLRSV